MVHSCSRSLADAIVRFIELIHCKIDAEAFDALMRTELTMTQLRVIKLLMHAESPRPIFEIAQELKLSLATAGRAVDHLVRHDFAQRWEDPDDRRSKLVCLTAAGRELTEAPHTAARKQIDALADALPPDVAADLNAALRRATDCALPTDAARPGQVVSKIGAIG